MYCTSFLSHCRFEENSNGWKKISFGPDFGGAIDEKGQLGCLKHGRDIMWGDEMGFGSETTLRLRFRIFRVKLVNQLIFTNPQGIYGLTTGARFSPNRLACVMTRWPQWSLDLQLVIVFRSKALCLGQLWIPFHRHTLVWRRTYKCPKRIWDSARSDGICERWTWHFFN